MDDRENVRRLADGAAFVDLSFWRKVVVAGPDGRAWLNDLVSADVSELEPGRARRSLLLSPTGRVRAEFTIVAREGGFVLVQDPMQPTAIDALLAPYTLSSAVAVEDRTADLALFAFPGGQDPAHIDIDIDIDGVTASTPSCQGGGCDLLGPAEWHDDVAVALTRRLKLAGNEELEAWRILAGIPRLGVDAEQDDLPQEAALTEWVAFDKGCYLGQEAVAKVQNLGHPRRLLLHLEALGEVAPGDIVQVEGRHAGEVTSVAEAGNGRNVLFARIRWGSRDGPFTTAMGTALTPRREP